MKGEKRARKQALTGKGLLDGLISQDYSTATQSMITKHADEIVTKITIVRTPLAMFTNLVLNIVSLGQYEKAKFDNKYDDYFHLNLNVTTDKGTKLIIEKNEVIGVRPGHHKTAKSEVMDVVNVRPVSLKDMMDKTQKKMSKKYFVYNGKSNNCQVFVNSVLTANKIITPEYRDFIMQNTNAIFENSPAFRKLANSVTDIGAVITNTVDTVKPILGVTTVPISNTSVPESSKTVVDVLNNGIVPYLTGSGVIAKYSKADMRRMRVKDIRQMVKDHKKDFGRKITVGGLKKSELVALVFELMEKE